MRRVLFLLAVFAAPPAFAHPGHDAMGFIGGLLHPVIGVDHLLAALVVGLWAGQLGGRARWAVPLGFVSAMALSTVAAATTNLLVPHFEAGITASLICIGALVAIARRVAIVPAAFLVMAFAVFHGAAHGTEAAFVVDGADIAATTRAYVLGLLLATALLHGAGLLVGARMRVAVRALGALTSVAGVAFALA
jgi:urease accessory protein